MFSIYLINGNLHVWWGAIAHAWCCQPLRRVLKTTEQCLPEMTGSIGLQNSETKDCSDRGSWHRIICFVRPFIRELKKWDQKISLMGQINISSPMSHSWDEFMSIIRWVTHKYHVALIMVWHKTSWDQAAFFLFAIINIQYRLGVC